MRDGRKKQREQEVLRRGPAWACTASNFGLGGHVSKEPARRTLGIDGGQGEDDDGVQMFVRSGAGLLCVCASGSYTDQKATQP